ncbi:unnamed protein product [Diamesa hyperborea]
MASENNKSAVLKKYAGRAKEKILQNLGKVDRTADEIFDEHLNNFQLQQNSANRLQKEFNNYIRCIRAVQVASKTLMEAMTEVYEPQWSGSEALYAQASSIEVLWQDFSHKLGDQVLIPLNTYTAQFPEMRKKIDKRGRKLVDYDGQRHSFQNLQANAAKRKDDVKLTKGREQLEEAKRTYEMLNTELHDELPALYDSRILFLVTNLQTLYASEQMFHNETSKIYAELEAIVDKLATESQRGSYTLKKLTSASSPSPTSSSNSPTPYEQHQSQSQLQTQAKQDDTEQQQYQNQESMGISEPSYQNAAALNMNNNINNNNVNEDENSAKRSSTITNNNNDSLEQINVKTDSTPATIITTNIIPTAPATPTPAGTDQKLNINNSNNNISKNNIINNNNNNAIISNNHTKTNNNNNSNNNMEELLYDIPVGATTTDLPAGVLYRVKATYKYVREDADELSFEVGDTIQVIEYDDPEDQEEGWLMGTKEGSDEKGMFPANFTRPM